MTAPNKNRPIRVIAYEIRSSWRPMYFAAIPYWEAMTRLDSINDMYGLETGREIVARFLGNASTWRGPKARMIKKELNDMLKGGRK